MRSKQVERRTLTTGRDAAGLLSRKVPLTRANGATSPATKRERRIISGAERYTLTRAR
jgi:hypothetical protein